MITQWQELIIYWLQKKGSLISNSHTHTHKYTQVYSLCVCVQKPVCEFKKSKIKSIDTYVMRISKQHACHLYLSIVKGKNEDLDIVINREH